MNLNSCWYVSENVKLLRFVNNDHIFQNLQINARTAGRILKILAICMLKHVKVLGRQRKIVKERIPVFFLSTPKKKNGLLRMTLSETYLRIHECG